MTDERVFWRRRQRPRELAPRHENPYFSKDEARHRRRAVSILLWIVLVILILVAGAWTIWGDFFRLEHVIVEGNAFLPTGDFVRISHEVARQNVLRVIPGDNLLIFSTNRFQGRLQEFFGEQQALERLVVTKRLPSALVISVTERVPNVVYTTGGLSYLIDRSGKVARQIAPDERVNPNFPVILDQTTRTVSAGKQLAATLMVDFLFSVRGELSARTTIPVDFFYLPPARCLDEPEPPAPAERGSDEVADNEATDPDSANQNTNRRTNVNASNRNTNAARATTLNANTNASATKNVPAGETCDLEQQALVRRELRVHSTEDWEMFFRSDDSAATQVTRLLRVLDEKHLDRTKLDYIDLRFGERVIVK